MLVHSIVIWLTGGKAVIFMENHHAKKLPNKPISPALCFVNACVYEALHDVQMAYILRPGVGCSFLFSGVRRRLSQT